MTPTMIDRADHDCPFTWCSGTIWPHDHSSDCHTTPTTGRDDDLADVLAVTVVVSFDELTDPRPRILLHLGTDDGAVDVDVSPTAAEARRIAVKLLEAADALDGWVDTPDHFVEVNKMIQAAAADECGGGR